MAEEPYAASDQAIRDIVAQIQGIPPPQPVAPPASLGVMPAPEVTPSMMAPTAAAPGPAGPTSVGGAPLSGTTTQWATTPPPEDPHSWFNGGLGPSAQASPNGAANKLLSYLPRERQTR